MKHLISRFVVMMSVGFLLSGCAAYALSPLTGVIYTDVKAPVTATSNSGGVKVGQATATSILGLVATGDASIQAAMQEGGITKVDHVDYHTTSILGIYATYTVTVYGQ